MKKKEKGIFLIISIMIAIGLFVGISYAWWSYTATQETINKISSDCLKIEIEDENNSSISLEKAYPLTDEESKELKPYTFKVKNTCNLSVVYDVNLEVMDVENRLKSEYVATSFENREKKILNTYPSVTSSYKGKDYTGIEAYGLTSGELKAGESKNYSIKLWINESVTVEDDAMNKMFIGKISVNASLNQVAEVYKEEILNGAEPVLKGDLIPVVIASDGTVTKANEETEWYKYEEKKWANAVILLDKTKSYNSYDVIPEENIESYFVWIPKYSYQLWDLGEYNSLTKIDESKIHEISIRFGITDTNDANEGECTTPMNTEKTQGLSGESGACQIGDYMTHPAFISMQTNGLWVGKFKTGYKGAQTRQEAEKNVNEASKVQIKPNVYSWRGIQIANAHLSSYNYKRELDSHMMKNTEWGAVAYLQHSIYGNASGLKNNNLSIIYEFKTGQGLGTFSYYDSAIINVSSTGNYSGIYDFMSNGYEWVMAVELDSAGNPMSGRHSLINSGFNGTYECVGCEGSDLSLSLTNGIDWPDKKYYDTYKYVTGNALKDFNIRILGDATGEMGPFGASDDPIQISSWYKSESRAMGNDMAVFFCRAKLFNFHSQHGMVSDGMGYRIVLAI